MQLTFPDFTNIPQLISVFIGVGALILLSAYYFLYFSKLSFYKKSGETENSFDKPVTIIICARNERENLAKNLPLILAQEYPSYQLVVVNDCSWDETEQLLEELEKKHSNLKVVTLEEQEKYEHGKKFALTMGIKAAANEYLLMTDADCQPVGKYWLRDMARNFSTAKRIVIGYGPFHKSAGFLNKLIRFDSFHTGIQYLSFALSRNPYMGVGRNLAYTKSLFFEHKGFAAHQHVLSGDDDLFVNMAATPANTSVELSPASFTYSTPKSTFADWTKQKVRHHSTSKYYKSSHQFLLSLYWIAQIVFYISLPAILITGGDWKIVAILFLLKTILQYIIFGVGMKKLLEMDLIWLLPIYDFILLLIYPTFALRGYFGKHTRWK